MSGAMASGVEIALSGAGGGTAITDGSGTYAFTGLSNGVYTLTPWKDSDYTFLPVSRNVTVTDANVTGQDFTAIDAEWANWSIPAASRPTSDYSVDVAAGTVTDDVTGLVWQRDVAAGGYTWEGAKSYCRSLDLGGWSSGWRLPTIIELESIVDFGTSSPAIDTAAFPNPPPSAYLWSSSSFVGYGSTAFAVSVDSGAVVSYGNESSLNRVRCVR